METTTTNSHLITVKQLAAKLFEEGTQELKSDIPSSLKIIDSSAGGDAAQENFLSKAIPGALFLNVFGDLKDKEGKYPNTFPSGEIVSSALQNIGVEKSDEIVLYTTPGKHVGATRAFVILTSYGLDVKILDGGLAQYEKEGYPTQKGNNFTGCASKIEALTLTEEVLTSLEEMHDFEEGNKDSLQVIDMRPARSFNGDAPDNPEGCRQGNIKGSINILPGEFLNEDGTFRSEQEISEVAEKYNLDSQKDTVVM